MAMDETISVIMSVYNEREAWLRAAVESILGQTHADLEFLIVLDAPDNAALERVILSYAGTDSRIRFLKNDRNRGLVYSLNRALDEAAGAYIARMDADDIAEPKRLEAELRALREEDLDLVAANILHIDENGAVLDAKTPYCYGQTAEACRRHLAVRDFMPHPTWLARASAYRTVGRYHDVPCAEDYEWLCRAAALGMRMRKLPTPLLRYRVRAGSISTSRLYPQQLVTQVIAREYRRALRRGELVRAEAIERGVSRLDLQADSAPYAEALDLYAAAWERMRENRAAGIAGIARAVVRCPYLLCRVRDNIRVRRIDRKYSHPSEGYV